MKSFLMTVNKIKWVDPFLWGFILIFGMVFFALPDLSTVWLSTLLIPSGTILAVILVVFLTGKQGTEILEIPRPSVECRIVAGWYICLVVLSTIFRGEGILANEFAKWLWFVIIPLIFLWVVRRRSDNTATLLKSVGLRRQNLGRGLLTGFLAFLVLLPFMIMSMPSSQLERLHGIIHEPFKAIILILICFILALATAGFTEEMFFRGMIQSRLAQVFKSEMRSCLLTAFLFGVYHLPYAYFLSSWPTHGNLLWAVASVLTEQMIAGVILGVLWARTHNLAASVLLHALIDVIPIMVSLNINIG